MPKIVDEAYFDGSEKRISRLGLSTLWQEVRETLCGFTLLILEKKDGNGGAAVRKLIDERFSAAQTVWAKKVSGGVDWTAVKVVDGTKISIGVEIQMSARSDLIAVDLIHLRDALEAGDIDVGVLVVPGDRLARFLTDRGPSFATARRHAARLEHLPLIIIGIEHDGPGPALQKQPKRSSRS